MGLCPQHPYPLYTFVDDDIEMSGSVSSQVPDLHASLSAPQSTIFSTPEVASATNDIPTSAPYTDERAAECKRLLKQVLVKTSMQRCSETPGLTVEAIEDRLDPLLPFGILENFSVVMHQARKELLVHKVRYQSCFLLYSLY